MRVKCTKPSNLAASVKSLCLPVCKSARFKEPVGRTIIPPAGGVGAVLGAPLGLWAMSPLGPRSESLRKGHRSKVTNFVRVGAARG